MIRESSLILVSRGAQRVSCLQGLVGTDGVDCCAVEQEEDGDWTSETIEVLPETSETKFGNSEDLNNDPGNVSGSRDGDGQNSENNADSVDLTWDSISGAREYFESSTATGAGEDVDTSWKLSEDESTGVGAGDDETEGNDTEVGDIYGS